MEQAAEAVRRVASRVLSDQRSAKQLPGMLDKSQKLLLFIPPPAPPPVPPPVLVSLGCSLELHPLITPRSNSLRLLPQGCPEVPSRSVPARASLSKGSTWTPASHSSVPLWCICSASDPASC